MVGLTMPGNAHRQVTRMGNKSTSGVFVPVVKLVRAAVGKKEFNQLRGKGISLHSQGTGVFQVSCAGM